MKRVLASFVVVASLAFGFLAAPPLVQAAPFESKDLFSPACQGEAAASTTCQVAKEDETRASNSIYGPNGVLTKVVRVLSVIVGVAAVIMIIVGGIKYVLSDGDSGKISSAKSTIIYAIIGLIIAVVAPSIITFTVKALL